MEYPQLKRAIDVIASLRHPQSGCPWDLKQTHHSLLKYLVEESYEYLHATETNNIKAMEEELGDVLLQILLHAQIASESGHFNIESVAKKLADKMIHRHPHVFGNGQATTAEEVRSNWENQKMQEKTSERYIKIEDTHMPALMSSQKIGEKSKKVNFDWDNVDQVIQKVDEEWEEFKQELHKKKRDQKLIREELGDMFFSLVQVSRHLEFEAEEVLREANTKFIKRFHKLEDKVKDAGEDILKLPVEQLENYWAEVKKELKS